MTRAPVTEETALVPTNDENPTGEGHNHPTLHHQNSHVKNLGEDVPLYARGKYMNYHSNNRDTEHTRNSP